MQETYGGVDAAPAPAAPALARKLDQEAQPAPKSRPKSGYYGVYANNNRWQASLTCDGKTHNLGTFNTKEEAAVVYNKAAQEHRGSAALCNFVTTEEFETAAAAAGGSELKVRLGRHRDTSSITRSTKSSWM
jgi:hypothetical protein